MNARTRTAVAAALFLCLASTASAKTGYGVGTGPDTSAANDGVTIEEYNSREEAEAALRRHIDAEAENAKKSPFRSMNAERLQKIMHYIKTSPSTSSRPSTSP